MISFWTSYAAAFFTYVTIWFAAIGIYYTSKKPYTLIWGKGNEFYAEVYAVITAIGSEIILMGHFLHHWI